MRYYYKRSSFNVWFSGWLGLLRLRGITAQDVAEGLGVSVETVLCYCYKNKARKSTMWVPICDLFAGYGLGSFGDLYTELDLLDRGVCQ